MLHGEQYVELLKPFPVSGSLVSKVDIAEVVDKGSGALAIINGNFSLLRPVKVGRGLVVVWF